MAKAIVKSESAPLRELTLVKGTSGIVAVPPSSGIEVYDDMGDGTESTGLEDVSLKDRRIPILRPLASNSPECRPVEDGGLPGATQGTIFNTTTKELYDRKLGLYFVPFLTELRYLLYVAREEDGSGGGFRGVFEPNDPFVDECRKRTLEKHKDLFRKWDGGTDEETGKPLELVETQYIYGVMVVPNEDGSYPGEMGVFFPAAIPFSSTQLKQHSAFLERCKNMKYRLAQKDGSHKVSEVAMWSHVWHLRPYMEKRGTLSWWGWRVGLATRNEEGLERPYQESRLVRTNPLYKFAEDMRTTVLEGNAQTEYHKDAGSSEQAADNRSSDASAEIPGI